MPCSFHSHSSGIQGYFAPSIHPSILQAYHATALHLLWITSLLSAKRYSSTVSTCSNTRNTLCSIIPANSLSNPNSYKHLFIPHSCPCVHASLYFSINPFLFLLLLKEVGSARLRESDLHPISPKTPAPQYQPIDRKKRKEKLVEDNSRDREA